MYQFVRAVQGRSIEITAAVNQLAATPIGFEKGAKGFDWSKVEKEPHLLTAAGKPAAPHKVGKF